MDVTFQPTVLSQFSRSNEMTSAALICQGDSAQRRADRRAGPGGEREGPRVET